MPIRSASARLWSWSAPITGLTIRWCGGVCSTSPRRSPVAAKRPRRNSTASAVAEILVPTPGDAMRRRLFWNRSLSRSFMNY